MRRAALLGLAVLLCSGVAHAATTLERTIVPGRAQAGYVPLTYGPGDPRLVRKDLAAPKRGRAKRRRSLVYFAQLSDFQLADEESPLRVEFIDQSNNVFSAAWRPQEALVPYVIEASIRQVNRNRRSMVRGRRGRRAKLAFTLLTGDNADNQQGNEAAWVARLLDGGPMNPNTGVVDNTSMQGQGCAAADSAALAAEAPKYTGVQELATGTFYNPDAPTGQFAAFPSYPGLMDRAQRPFVATGLRGPSYVTLGNHDGLVQGNQAATSDFTAIATGCLKPMAPALSASNLGQALAGLPAPGSAIVPPDPDRAPVTKPQYRARFGNRHGFQHIAKAEAEASRGAATYYSFAPRRGLRFIALDTVANAGVTGPGAEGNIDDPQFQWLVKTITTAEKRDELVFLFSHHGPTSLTTDMGDEVAGSCDNPDNPSDAGCDLDPRSSTPMHLEEDVVATLLSHPHVIAWIAGHTHVNDVAFYKDADSGFWVVRTSAEADWPHQDRLLELMDNRDGTLSLFGTLIDNAAPAAAPQSGTDAAPMTTLQLASIGRTLGFNDPQTSHAAAGQDDDKNVELLLRDPRR